jgi:uncharacterized protein YndB with AHSA1/START domain
VPEVRRAVHAAPDAVWAVLADPMTYPEWLIGAKVIRDVDPGFPAPGTDFHHSVGPTEEVAVPDRTTALEAERPTLLKLKVRARPFFEGVVTFRLLPTKAGTEVVMLEQPTGLLRFAAPLLSPLIVGRNRRSLELLARRVDSATSP